MGGVTLTDAEGSSDLLGNDDSSQIVNTSYDASSFHISSLLVNGRITMLVFVRAGDLYARKRCTVERFAADDLRLNRRLLTMQLPGMMESAH